MCVCVGAQKCCAIFFCQALKLIESVGFLFRINPHFNYLDKISNVKFSKKVQAASMKLNSVSFAGKIWKRTEGKNQASTTIKNNCALTCKALFALWHHNNCHNSIQLHTGGRILPAKRLGRVYSDCLISEWLIQLLWSCI